MSEPPKLLDDCFLHDRERLTHAEALAILAARVTPVTAPEAVALAAAAGRILAEAVTAQPSAELVVLLERAAGHLVKVILRADDSDGLIGDLARRVLDLHQVACAGRVADPVALAKNSDVLLVITPGGHIGKGSTLGDSVIAYALPD